jgi:hypothetical protein
MAYNSNMSAALLDRLLEPSADCLTQEAARKIVDLRASEADQARVDELADKANRGTLTDAERMDYDRHLAAFHFVTMMQARARRLLQN